MPGIVKALLILVGVVLLVVFLSILGVLDALFDDEDEANDLMRRPAAEAVVSA